MRPASTRIQEPALRGELPTGDGHATEEEIEAIGRARMEQARVDLLLDHAYFATALLAIPMRGTSEPTLAHAVTTDGTRIVYRYDLVAALDRPTVRVLIMHALLHVVLRHPERGGNRDWGRWTSACDIAVDLLLMSLGVGNPGVAENPRRYFGLSAEAIYDRLLTEIRAGPTSSHVDGLLPPAAEARARSESTEDDVADRRDAFERILSGTETPTEVSLECIHRDFIDAMDGRLSADGTPKPGGRSSEVDAARAGKIDWRRMLARFMREPFDREWSFMRPNRRHIWRGLYLPGPMPVEGGRFVVAIDTSGSMSDCDLGMVLAEVDALRRGCASELTVLQFDARVQATAEFSRWGEEEVHVGSTKVMRMYGRGGTDLRVPFEWVEKEQEGGRTVSALIVCTDGYGLLPPEAPPGIPVLFLLTPTHRAPSFGEQAVLRR